MPKKESATDRVVREVDDQLEKLMKKDEVENGPPACAYCRDTKVLRMQNLEPQACPYCSGKRDVCRKN